jgi:glycolate oxidase
MSLEKMNRIIKLDTETMTLTVEAGVTIAEISEFLAETPYFYAPDPGVKQSIGGNADQCRWDASC